MNCPGKGVYAADAARLARSGAELHLKKCALPKGRNSLKMPQYHIEDELSTAKELLHMAGDKLATIAEMYWPRPAFRSR
jgi:hypothetical protein